MQKSPEIFWNWFVSNAEQLTMLNDIPESEGKQLLEQMQQHLDAYCEGLTFEVSEQTAQGRTVTFSAEGGKQRCKQNGADDRKRNSANN